MSNNDFYAWLQASAPRDNDTGRSAKQVLELIQALREGGAEVAGGAADPSALAEEFRQATNRRLETLDAVSTRGAELVGRFDPKQDGELDAWLKRQASGDPKQQGTVEQLEAFLAEPGREDLKASPNAETLRAAIGAAREQIERRCRGLPERVAALYREFAGGIEPPPPENLLDYIALQAKAGDPYAAQLEKLLQGSKLEGAIRKGQAQLQQILALIDEPAASLPRGISKPLLRAEAVRYFTDFNNEETEEEGPEQMPLASSARAGWAQWLAIGSIILAAMAVIGVFLLKEGRLAQLSDIALARGFITFIFTIGTISLFLVVTASTVFDSESKPVDKYNRAKTILSMLVGIFGTVLGYYFGLPADGAKTGAEQAFELREIRVDATKDDLKAGKFRLLTSVSGGKAPFTCYVKVLDGEGKLVEKASKIVVVPSESFLVPMEVLPPEKATEYTVSLRAEDADAKTSTPGETRVSLGKQ